MTVPQSQSRPLSRTNARPDRETSPRPRRSGPARSHVEHLEGRQLLTFSATLAGNLATFTVGTAPDSVIFSAAGGNLQHNPLTAPAGETFADNADFDSIVAGSQNLAAAAGSTVNVGTAASTNAFTATVGTPASPASTLQARFNLFGSSGSASSATVDDSGSAVGKTYTVGATSIIANGINVGLAGSPFGGPGGLALLTGTGTNVDAIQATSSPTTLTAGGTDAITVGNAGLVSGILAPLTIRGLGASTSLVLDNSAATNGSAATLVRTAGGQETETGLASAVITFGLTGNSPLTINSGGQTSAQTIDFSGGNPIVNGLTFLGGSNTTLALVGALPGGPTAVETLNTTGPLAGNLTLDGTTINLTNVQNINDTTPATNLTENYLGGLDDRITVGVGPTVGGAATTSVANFSTAGLFPTEDYANKANVRINAGPNNDNVNVAGAALLPGSNTVIDGLGGANVLNYDAGGATVVITPTGGPGNAATIARPGSGALLVQNFQAINVTNGQVQGVPIVAPSLNPTTTIRGFTGIPLVDADLATFTSPSAPNALASNFGASITWGDGTTTAGTILPDAENPTVFHVQGSHTYFAPSPPGGYALSISVSQRQTNTTTAPGITVTQTSTATTASTALIAVLANSSPAAAVAAGTEGTPFTGVFARFTDSDLTAIPANFQASINFGDGQIGQGVVTADPATPGQFLVTGTHTYAVSGTFSATVNLSDRAAANSSTLAITRPVTVAAAAVTPGSNGTTIAAIAGMPFTGVVATFTSANPLAVAADFTASVNFGDGSAPVAGQVLLGADGVFDVLASHTFATPTIAGVPVVTTTIREGINPATTSVSNMAFVSGAALNGIGTTIIAVVGAPFTGNVATFTLPGGVTAPAAGFTGTINWGDGTTTPIAPADVTTVAATGGSTIFSVAGTHTYTRFGTFPVAVTLNTGAAPGAALSTGFATGTATVADAILTNTSAGPLNVQEGNPFTAVIGTFRDPNLSATAANFTATVSLGNGQTVAGVVTADPANPGQFLVTATGTFPRAGSYQAQVTVADVSAPGGSTLGFFRPIVVSGATLTTAAPLAPVNAVVGVPFTGSVATFTSSNPLSTPADFTATVNFGDGSAPAAGVVTEGADGTFFVTGAHTFNSASNGRPITVTIRENASGVVVTGGSTAVVTDARLTAQGATLSGVTGLPLSERVVATFNYAGPALPAADFAGSINWGDGTTTPINATNLDLIGTPLGAPTYVVAADHTYRIFGTFPVTTTLFTPAGSSAVASGTATVADNLAVVVPPIAATQNGAFTGVVATITEAGAPSPASKYSATINWGDGSPIVPGTVVFQPDGTLQVLGTHVFIAPGVFPVSVTVTNNLSGITTGTASATVAAAPIFVNAQLDPASDSGVSSSDAITDINRPRFFGRATPGINVFLSATPIGTANPIVIGSATVDASGAFSITSNLLPDGVYIVQAIGVDRSGTVSTVQQVLPNALQGFLTIDTVAPKVAFLQFKPLSGRVIVTFQDDRTGLDQGSIGDGTNYSFSFLGPLPGLTQAAYRAGSPLAAGYVVTNVTATPTTGPTVPQTVAVTIDNGQMLRGGFYRITIRSGGVRDVAGNALDGTYYGYFPSGKNTPGGDFVADLTSVHTTVLPALPVGTSASPLANPGTRPTSTTIPAVHPTRHRVDGPLGSVIGLPGQYFPGSTGVAAKARIKGQAKAKPAAHATTAAHAPAAHAHIPAAHIPAAHIPAAHIPAAHAPAAHIPAVHDIALAHLTVKKAARGHKS